MTSELGRLESVPLRDVWPREANDFTPWLALPENLALLAKTLDLGEFSEVRTEVPVVSFFIDILAKNEQGAAVVIENQFGPTDHNHLGQIMTYLAGQKGDVTVVWIAEIFREEHRATIDWLNAEHDRRIQFLRCRNRGLEDRRLRARAEFQRGRQTEQLEPKRRHAIKNDGELQGEYAAYWTEFDTFLKARATPFTVTGNPLCWSCSFPLGAPGVSLLAAAARGNNRVAVEL